MGKSILIPKTAIAIPRVKNLRCRRGDICLSTEAFTTALSKDKDVSKTPRISMINTVWSPAAIFRQLPAPRQKPMMIAMVAKMIDPLKYSLIMSLNTIKCLCSCSIQNMSYFNSSSWKYSFSLCIDFWSIIFINDVLFCFLPIIDEFEMTYYIFSWWYYCEWIFS